jgi:hypothetical protein
VSLPEDLESQITRGRESLTSVTSSSSASLSAGSWYTSAIGTYSQISPILGKTVRAHHHSLYRLARELEHAAKQGELVIGELVLDAEGHKGLELGFAVRDAVVVGTDQPVEELHGSARGACIGPEGCPALLLTRAIGLATGYMMMMRARTKGANVAPIASPYLLQMAAVRKGSPSRAVRQDKTYLAESL